jgi:hypothetical protein
MDQEKDFLCSFFGLGGDVPQSTLQEHQCSRYDTADDKSPPAVLDDEVSDSTQGCYKTKNPMVFYRNCARKPIPSLPASAVG